MPKPSKQIIIDAIIKGIAIGKERGQLLGTIGKKWEVSRTTFDRLWKIANEQHRESHAKVKAALAKVDIEMAIEARKKAIMSADERKEYLTQIIRGEIEVPYSEAKWDKVTEKFVKIPFMELAGHSSRISAIAELNKMDGEYAATKSAVIVTNIGKDAVEETYE